MRGEFIGVWSETWREIWLPLVEQPFGEDGESLPEDIFCELYWELSKALKKPTDAAAEKLLLGDAISLREVFEGAAQRAKPDLEHETVKEAFANSGAEEVSSLDRRRAVLEAALSEILGVPAGPFLDAQLQEHARDVTKLDPAWKRMVEGITNDPQASREAFERTRAEDIAGERALVDFLESVHDTLEQFENPGDDALTNRYFNLLAAFIEKYSLRYDLRRPCVMCPTLPGIFANLVRSLTSVAELDINVARRLRDFKEALQDLRLGATEARIGNCVAKQIMLLEAIASAGGARGDDLAALCKAVSDWPHPAVRSSLLSLYGFASDFPGLRHGTPSRGMTRELDMRDMVAMSILLTGFTPHLNRQLSADAIYGGGTQSAALAAAAQFIAMPAKAGSQPQNRARGFLRRFFGRVLGGNG